MTDTAPATAREPRRGREARRSARAQRSLASIPYITRKIPLTELVSEEGLQTIERNAETLLEEVGVEFREFPPAIELFRGAGCDIKGERVRFPRGLARSLCATTPARYVQHARNPERNVTIGGDAMVFAPNYGSPFVHDLDKGRRYGTLEDFQNFVKLAYVSPYIHHSGGTVCGAGRSAGQQAAFRDGVRACQIFGQAVHGLCDQARTGRGQRAHLRAS